MEIRQVNDGELVAAARLVYAGLPEADRLAHLTIERAPLRLGIDFRHQIVALDNGCVRGSCLYILSPGRSATVLPPELDRRRPLPEHLAAFATGKMILLAGRACREAGALLVQTLLDDSPEQPSGKLFIEAGFRHLALLEYLEMPVDGPEPHQAEDRIWTWETFRSGREKDFTRVIERTYQGSLDCPQLDHLRSAADALAGHRSSGRFTPEGWLLARRNGQAAGLVLVNRALGRSACSLVYMGVVPEHRGTGLGRTLLGRAIGKTVELGGDILTVTVDSSNTPARRLYEEVGLQRVGSRHVYYLPHHRR